MKKNTDSRYLLKKRYITDYKTVKRLGPDGRLHSELVYAGDYYHYKTPEVIRFCAGRLLFASIFAAVAFIAVFCLHNLPLLRDYYVGLAHLVTGFSLWWNIRGGWIAFRKKPPLERKEADCVGDKLHMSAWFGLITSGVAVIGCAVYVIRGEELTFEITVTLGLIAFELAYYIYVFTRRKVFATVIEKKTPPDENREEVMEEKETVEG